LFMLSAGYCLISITDEPGRIWLVYFSCEVFDCGFIKSCWFWMVRLEYDVLGTASTLDFPIDWSFVSSTRRDEFESYSSLTLSLRWMT